jgi:formylmethanofuran dehydrogenase subunit E
LKEETSNMSIKGEIHKKFEDETDIWNRNSAGFAYSFKAYANLVESFHGHAAPGMIIGGKMVDIALQNIPQGMLFDAICETANCLPDAIQLLTPCTIGNGWLKIVRLGRFAINLYDKYKGDGVRVSIDSKSLNQWPEIKSWFFELKPKAEQDTAELMIQIRSAGHRIYGVQQIKVHPNFLKKSYLGEKGICPQCNESYPLKHGALCLGCRGDAPFKIVGASISQENNEISAPDLKVLPVDFSLGQRVLHDMTQIIPGESKGPAFKKGQILQAGDICRLQQMGRQRIYVDGGENHGNEWVHENDVATAFAEHMAGEGVVFDTPPREGKINLKADWSGMLMVDEKRLERLNMLPGVMCACRKNYSLTMEGHTVAGTRAIPLYLSSADFGKALRVLKEGPLFRIQALRKARIGILITGSEIFQGLVKDRFEPIIQAKAESLGCKVVRKRIVPDDREAICRGILELMDHGADLLITTAGLSVDPDDVTRKGIVDAGAEDLLYGAPILPGAMTLLARIGNIQLLGIPACALYFKTTSLDLLLPRLLAGVKITRNDLARMGNGALCLECKACTFPKCPFGK